VILKGEEREGKRLERLKVLSTQIAPTIGNLRRKTEDRSKDGDKEGEALELAEEHGVATISIFIEFCFVIYLFYHYHLGIWSFSQALLG